MLKAAQLTNLLLRSDSLSSLWLVLLPKRSARLMVMMTKKAAITQTKSTLKTKKVKPDLNRTKLVEMLPKKR